MRLDKTHGQDDAEHQLSHDVSTLYWVWLAWAICGQEGLTDQGSHPVAVEQAAVGSEDLISQAVGKAHCCYETLGEYFVFY